MKKKMKYICSFIVSILSGLTVSCDTLEIDNLSSYDESMVWVDENLATSYVNNLYSECFPNWTPTADNNSEQICGMPFYRGIITLTGDSYKRWTYREIRHINVAISNLQDSPLQKETSDFLLGQVYFMRAYMYYWMVLYHGGVPYITFPQDKDKDDLYVKRNSTAECFDMMIDDLDKAISLLPEKIDGNSSDYGRIDQCFAKAWKAKTLLLKASPQFNPKNMYDNKYWNDAYNSAKEAYEFCLAHGSKLADSYKDIWLKERGPEVIFPIVNSSPNKVSDWETNIRPNSVSYFVPVSNPTWEFVKMFPMLDGKLYNDPSGIYYKSSEDVFLQSFWENRDPRFYEVILFNGAEYPVAGKPVGYRQYNALGISDPTDYYGINPNAHATATNNDIFTGFYNRKASDLSLTQPEVIKYDIDYILMRFAEVMLIYAEAANETGHSDISIEILKRIRERAGIEKGKDGLFGLKVNNREEIRKAILDERNIELCFEGHRFWDLRRTRNMMQLNGLTKHGVEAIAVNEDGSDMDLNKAKELVLANELKPSNFRYQLLQVPYSPAAEKEFVIDESFYFFPIQQVRIDENPNLEQNIGWGGNFNPALE